jgi:hypothetical protein
MKTCISHKSRLIMTLKKTVMDQLLTDQVEPSMAMYSGFGNTTNTEESSPDSIMVNTTVVHSDH